MSYKAGKLNHIEIYVSDLERSKAFWGWFLEKLGYEKFQLWDNGFSYILGFTYIVFVQTEKKYLDIPYNRCRAGLNHLAFNAKSKKQIDEVTEELKVKGIKILYENKHPYAGGKNHYAVYFEDPDRIKIELTA